MGKGRAWRSMTGVKPMGETDVDTCQYGAYDQAGNPLVECERTDYEEFMVGEDNDIVRLCPRHRSWVAALGAGGVKPMGESDTEACGSFGCVLVKGHNMGRADIPENHLVPERRESTNPRLEKAYWAGYRFGVVVTEKKYALEATRDDA